MKRLLTLTAIVALLLPLAGQAQPGRDRPGDNRPGPGRSGDNHPGPGRPGDNRPGPGRPGDNRPGRPGTRPPVHRPPAVRPPGRPQFSWHGSNFDRYRGPAFHYPAGFGYRRWSVGAILPGLFLNSTYYWNDWRGLGVGAPPPGRRWVRYGPDLVLVNVRSRRIEDVIPDVFY